MTTPYTTDWLVESVRNRITLPFAEASWNSGSLLDLATEEMQSDIVPLLLAVREDHYVVRLDAPGPTDPDAQIPIPPRAIGSNIRNVQFVSSPLSVIEVGRIRIEDQAATNRGYYVQNSGIRFLGQYASGRNVRVYYYLRPGRLVPTAETATVVSLSGTTGLVLDQVPLGWASGDALDIVQSQPNFQTLVWDSVATVSGSTVTLAGGFQAPGDPFSSLATAGVQVGDSVALAGESSVVQLPVEMHPILAVAAGCRVLSAIGSNEPALKELMGRLGQMKENALRLVTPRADSSPQIIFNRTAPSRQWY